MPVQPKRPPRHPHRCWAGAALVARTRRGSSSLTDPERPARALGRSPAAPAVSEPPPVMRASCAPPPGAARAVHPPYRSASELHRAQVLAERTVQRWVRELEMGGEAGA